MSKFASEADAFVWDISLDGGIEEYGSVDEGSWYGRLEFSNKDIGYLTPLGVIDANYAIIREDDQDFVYVEYFQDADKWDRAWEEIIRG